MGMIRAGFEPITIVMNTSSQGGSRIESANVELKVKSEARIMR